MGVVEILNFVSVLLLQGLDLVEVSEFGVLALCGVGLLDRFNLPYFFLQFLVVRLVNLLEVLQVIGLSLVLVLLQLHNFLL